VACKISSLAHDAIGIQTQLGITKKCLAYAENKKPVEGLKGQKLEFRELGK
jgi:hypothetical protein